MRVSSSRTTISVYVSPSELELIQQVFPEGTSFGVAYNNHYRQLEIERRNAGPRIHVATMYRGATPLYVISWAKHVLPKGGNEFPAFAILEAEGFTVQETRILVKLPPEEQRRRPASVHRRTKLERETLKELNLSTRPMVYVPPAKVAVAQPASGGTGRPLDTLDLMRHLCGKLNEIRNRHPENITFKVKSDGSVGFEFLVDE